MNRNLFAAAGILLLTSTSGSLSQPVAGSTQLGVSVTELRSVATGWSVKWQIIGQKVYNDKGETVGTVDDIIVAPDKALSYAIVGVGGYLGVGKHDVAVGVDKFKYEGGKLVLAGATKDALKTIPAFEYAR